MKRIALLGATGSIGASSLDVIARHPDRFQVTALAAGSRVDALADLCRRFRPRYAAIADATALDALASALATRDLDTQPLAGPEALTALAAAPEVDTVIAAVVGAAGLPSTLAAARAGKRILLANKEAVVMAGPLLQQALAAGGGKLVPVDSEHNAIFQCLPEGQSLAQAGVEKLILTASGGPFRGRGREALHAVTPEQAVAHPKWQMGAKISVDSATLMNKGLEVIEAQGLFGADADTIEVLIHPQSLVHSLVRYRDGSVLAQLGNPDMRTALAHALAWPERIAAGVSPLDLLAHGRLDFEAPDLDSFPCLDLAYRALRTGGTAPAILNAANEEAVAAFLAGGIGFLAIPEAIEATLNALSPEPISDLETVLAADAAARRQARAWIERRAGP